MGEPITDMTADKAHKNWNYWEHRKDAFPFRCRTTVQTPPPHDAELNKVYGPFLCVPMQDARYWGFNSADKRDQFVDQYIGTVVT